MIKSHIMGIGHIGIPTSDIENAKIFYQGLGFKIEGTEYLSNRDQHVVFLSLGGTMLEIYEEKITCSSEGPINHIAIDIVDADGLFKEISQAGYNIVAPGIEELPFWNSGIKFFKIIGPDSVVIEFCERK